MDMARDEFDPKGGWNWDEADLGPLETPLDAHIARAPAWLTRQAANRPPPTTPFHRLLRDRLGAEIAFHVPVFLPEIGAGYVLEFLLPQYGVSIEIGEDQPDDLDMLEWIVNRDNDLMAYEGIMTLRFPPERVRDHPERVLREIRECLGLEAAVSG